MLLRNISYRVIAFTSLFFALTFLTVSYYQYYQNLKTDTLTEYERIESALSRTMKVLAALSYTISTDYLAPDSIDQNAPVEHTMSMQNGMCWFTPKETTVPAENNQHLVSTVDSHDVNYLVVGLSSACDPNNEIYKKIQDKIVLAPIFSQLNEIDPFPTGLYFISKDNYGLVAPQKLGRQLKPEDFEVLKQRDFWLNSQNDDNHIRLNGPYLDTVTDNPIITFSLALRDKGKFVGLSFIDIQLNELLEGNTEAWPLIDLVNFSNEPLQQDASLVKQVRLDGVEMPQFLLTHLNPINGMKLFFKNHQSIFVFVIGLWFISTLGVFIMKAWLEKQHFIELAKRDPMTGLLNRRGLQANYRERKPLKYEAVAIFDIDDFKKINDVHGHDVGDEVICYVANQLENNTRQTDIVARFGGEEFIVYITAKTSEQILMAVKRMQRQISEHSTQVRQLEFTISCGLAFELVSENENLESLIKRADLKLYEAKNNGKNHVAV